MTERIQEDVINVHYSWCLHLESLIIRKSKLLYVLFNFLAFSHPHPQVSPSSARSNYTTLVVEMYRGHREVRLFGDAGTSGQCPEGPHSRTLFPMSSLTRTSNMTLPSGKRNRGEVCSFLL